MGVIESSGKTSTKVGFDHQIGSQLEQLGQTFCGRLPRQITKLKQLFTTLFDAGWNQIAADELYQMVHNLAGCGGFFGFPVITEKAQLLLGQLATKQTDDDDPAGLQRDDWDGIFNGLLRALTEAVAKITASTDLEIPKNTRQDKFRRSNKLVYIIDNDEIIAGFEELLIRELGYRVKTFEHPQQMIATSGLKRPDVLVMGTLFPEASMRRLGFLPNIRRRFGARIPVIFLSANTDAVTPLRAFRAGGDAYLQTPANPAILSPLLDEFSGADDDTRSKVFFGSQDALPNAQLAAQMTELGHSLLPIESNQSNPAVIEAFEPDGVVPGKQPNDCSAIQLASRLCQQPEWMRQPFLSARAER